jgi:hypothetical protein
MYTAAAAAAAAAGTSSAGAAAGNAAAAAAAAGAGADTDAAGADTDASTAAAAAAAAIEGGAAQRALLAAWVGKSDAALGPNLCDALQVSHLGAKLLPQWPLPQQLLFALGMLDTKYK